MEAVAVSPLSGLEDVIQQRRLAGAQESREDVGRHLLRTLFWGWRRASWRKGQGPPNMTGFLLVPEKISP